MAKVTEDIENRLKFGKQKYVALHLMLAKWLLQHAEPKREYVYVTLGGTELRDIQSLAFIGGGLISSFVSFESDPKYVKGAQQAVERLAAQGIKVALEKQSIFAFKRTTKPDVPHIIFVDLLGICAWGDYDREFGELFLNNYVREGDLLIITSHLGHNPGWDKVEEHFSAQFSILRADDAAKQRNIFRKAHPSMTLHRGLEMNSLGQEVKISCFGAIRYKDTTPMGLFGYAVLEGSTDLRTLVNCSDTGYFDASNHTTVDPSEF